MTEPTSEVVRSLPYERLERAAEEAVAEAFLILCSLGPEERFYGFALCTDCDVRSFYWSASSERLHRQVVEEWLRATREHFPNSDPTLEQAQWLHRYDVRSWGSQDRWLKATGKEAETLACWSDAVDALGEIWDAFEAIPMEEDQYFEWAEEVRRRCLEALVKGMRRFDRSFDWAAFREREELLLLVWVNDPDDPEEVREMARALNPVAAFARFSAQYHSAD